jgi:hypothetical protein
MHILKEVLLMYFSSNKIVYLLNIGGQLDFFSNKIIELKEEGLPVNDFDVFCATRVFYFVKHMILLSLISIISFFVYATISDYEYSNEYFFNFSFVFLGVLLTSIILFSLYVYYFYHHYNDYKNQYNLLMSNFDFKIPVDNIKEVYNIEDWYLKEKAEHVNSEINYFYKNLKTKSYEKGFIIKDGMILNIEKAFVDFFSFINSPLSVENFNYFLNKKSFFVFSYVMLFLLDAIEGKNKREFDFFIANRFIDLLCDFLKNNESHKYIKSNDFIDMKKTILNELEKYLKNEKNNKEIVNLKFSIEKLFSLM